MVEDKFSKVYRNCKSIPGEMERIKIEHEAGERALDKLSPEDRDKIIHQARYLSSSEGTRIRNFGEKAAFHLLQRLGVFFSMNNISSGRKSKK